MISHLSGGDIDTVIQAASALFDVPPETVELTEIFPAKIWIAVDKALLDESRVENAENIRLMMKRIVAAGVGFDLYFQTYRTYTSRVYISTAASTYSDITIRPVPRLRTFSSNTYINNTAYQYADITIRSVNQGG